MLNQVFGEHWDALDEVEEMTTCKYCNDRGCIACPTEQKKAQEKMPEPVPEPVFVARMDNEHDVELLKRFFGRETLESGVVPGVYPAVSTRLDDSIELRGALASLLQKLHDERESE